MSCGRMWWKCATDLLETFSTMLVLLTLNKQPTKTRGRTRPVIDMKQKQYLCKGAWEIIDNCFHFLCLFSLQNFSLIIFAETNEHTFIITSLLFVVWACWRKGTKFGALNKSAPVTAFLKLPGAGRENNPFDLNEEIKKKTLNAVFHSNSSSSSSKMCIFSIWQMFCRFLASFQHPHYAQFMVTLIERKRYPT